MATAKRLPSGSYRTQVFDYTDDAGKRHYRSFTAATKKEAEYMAAEYSMDKKEPKQFSEYTIGQAIDEYCALKSNILSPSTLREYKRMRETYYNNLVNLTFNKLTQAGVQQWVNAFALYHSPKTTRNAFGLLSAVIELYAKGMVLDITLPQKVRPDLHVPTDADIQRLLQYFASTDKDMEIAVYLSAFCTLRRSEVCALVCGDVIGNTIHINKAMVDKGNSEWIIKTTKTLSSTRIVNVPQFVISKLPVEGRIVNLNPNQITRRFGLAVKKTKIKPFRYHDLRHYAASVMHALGIPDQYIMQMGGWQSDNTLKSIYRGVMDDYQKVYSSIAADHFSGLMQHEIQHGNKKTAQ